MSDASSLLNVEREQPGRFPKSRFGGVVWTRLQGDALRAIAADEQPEIPEDPTPAQIDEKFNS
jgi:hypothetical protein